MDSVTILMGCMLFISGTVNVILVWSLKSAMSDMKELAREGLLASRAESAGDLATASVVAHQAAVERDEKPNKKEKNVANMKPDIPTLIGHDGRPIFPMRPIG